MGTDILASVHDSIQLKDIENKQNFQLILEDIS